MPKVSVIMPVYNAEKYLGEAIESVLRQTYADFELLLINDCSTDRSKEICMDYCEQDDRIVLLENNSEIHGPGPTRNIGLDHATGEYIYFVDADDWIEDRLLECAVNRMRETGADIVELGVIYELSNGQPAGRSCWNGKGVLTKENMKDIFPCFWKDTPKDLWLHLFRRDTVKDLKFESIFNGEDVCYMMDTLCRAEKVAFTIDAFYHYRYLNGSTSHRWVESTIVCLAEQWRHQCRFIRSLAEDADPLFYSMPAYGNYMWAIHQLSETFCPLSFREKRKELLRVKEIMDFDTYRGIYPFEMEHGLLRVKYMLVRYHLEWLILLLRPLYFKMVKMVKNAIRRKK
ncbi:MAG: glycosyltransferase family 2 protein [Firmicutes bacterium]|nr:glycosyltransferase family 2 protein [Bacillota bacterium]